MLAIDGIAGISPNVSFLDRSEYSVLLPNWERSGYPVQIEYGARDVDAGTCITVSRITGERREIPFRDLHIVTPGLAGGWAGHPAARVGAASEGKHGRVQESR